MVTRAGSPLTVPLILTREAWALPVLAVSLRMLSLRRWKMAAALLSLGAAALGYVSQLPHPNHYPLSGEIHLGWLFLQHHPWSPIWRLMFGLSLVPAMLVLLARRRNWHWLSEPDYGPALSIVVLIGLCHVIQAPVGGSDVSRIASAALPFWVAAGWAVAARSGAMWPTAALAAASLALWQPWHIVGTGASRYDAFFYPPAHEALPNALGLGAAAVLVAVAWWSSGRAHTRPSPPAPVDEPIRVASRT